jgi:uncharacterized OB-fold protein
MNKQCFKCKKTKSLEEFYKHKQMGDGHLGKCKTCTKKDVNGRYNDPEAKERIREYERKRFKEPERKKKIILYQLTMRAKSPRKNKARQAVNNALRDGRIVKQNCEKCGSEKSQAHHPDYRSPLKVMWLCFKHHREEHGQKVT